jgi:dTDP-4-amino-4,6-dideoxygalactose transaminase
MRRCIVRAYSPTPLFLLPDGKNGPQFDLRYPKFVSSGVGTPLFPKGRSCLAFLFRLFKKIRPNCDEIILPAYSAQSIAFAALAEDLRIKLVDVDDTTIFPDYDSFTAAFSPRTLAAVLPYNWGVFPPISTIKRFHDVLLKNKILWIDDFASSVPMNQHSDYYDVSSPCVFFSFGKTKITTMMDGGYAFFPEKHPYYPELSYALALSKTEINDVSAQGPTRFLINIAYHIYSSGPGSFLLNQMGLLNRDNYPKSLNFARNPLANGWGHSLLKIINNSFDSNLSRRLKISNIYRNKLSSKLSDYYDLYGSQGGVGSRFALMCKSEEIRDNLLDKLRQNCIGVSKGYQSWLAEIPLLKNTFLREDHSKYQGAISCDKQIITLPCHAKVTDEEAEWISTFL